MCLKYFFIYEIFASPLVIQSKIMTHDSSLDLRISSVKCDNKERDMKRGGVPDIDDRTAIVYVA